MSRWADGRTDGIVKIELEFWTQNLQFVQVPWGEDVLGEIARATSAKDGLGSQGSGRPGEPSCEAISILWKICGGIQDSAQMTESEISQM